MNLLRAPPNAPGVTLGRDAVLPALIEALPLGILLVAPDGRLAAASPRAREILGPGVEGHPSVADLPRVCGIHRASDFERYPADELPMQRALSGESARVDDATVRRGSEWSPIEIWASPLRDPESGACLAIAGLEDRSERCRAEEVLRRTERLASIGTLAAGIAHEINSPIQSILAAAEYALRSHSSPDGPVVVEKALHDVVQNARRCGRIVRSVLQFARQSRMDTWLHDLNEVVLRALDLIRRDPRASALRIETVLGPHPILLRMNAVQMEHVLVNILKNALDAPCGWVRVETGLGREVGCVAIEDDGPGLSDDELRRAFDPFFTTRRSRGGSGLGLSLAHAVVSQHRGSIRIEDAASGGTRVTVELPLGAAAPAGRTP